MGQCHAGDPQESSCGLVQEEMGQSLVAARVRDRFLIETEVRAQYTWGTKIKVASDFPESELVTAMVEAFWVPRLEVSSKTAFLGISKAVSKLLDLLRKAPHAWKALQETLAIEGWGDMNLAQKAKVLGGRLKELVHEGQVVLGKAFKKMADSFPLSLFFVPKSKMPGLTDLLHRIVKNVPWLAKALDNVHAGAVRADKLFEKYIPHLRRPVYAAIFIWVWLNVAELSWDLQGLIAGFTGKISLGELLGSMPESGIGFIAAAFGLGYGALPYVMIARLVWLVAQNYISYEPGKGLLVHWAKMGLRQKTELVTT